ncbi:MAG TPA: hypothetical protein VLF87_02410 [Patescibacteria group bacterium]|nr:hypothetical protein [Patescibacteria group bacterium]
MQPGSTIQPGQQPEGETSSPEQPAMPAANASPSPQAEAPQPTPEASEPAVPEANWQYSQTDTDPAAADMPLPDIDPVSWTASEFVEHEKNNNWYIKLGALTGVVTAGLYLLTRDIITAVVIVIASILFGITAKRKPRTLQYQLDNAGVHIGGKFYDYDLFKSFSVLEEGAFNSIQLQPLKRFMPPISLYYPPEQEDGIFTVIGSFLPHEERSHDAIDRLMRRVKF